MSNFSYTNSMRFVLNTIFMSFYLNIALTICALAQVQVPSVNASDARDPRGPSDITFCSQNLKNFGIEKLFLAREKGSTSSDYKRRIAMLTERFARENCDVIALQELLGNNRSSSEEALKVLSEALRVRTGRIFEGRFGPSNDRLLRLGFLVALDKVTIRNVVSYVDVELPKLVIESKPRPFTRGPLELELETIAQEGVPSKKLIAVTFHFKSKYAGYGDPAGLDYETYRMEMAEALRRIVLSRHKDAFSDGSKLLVLLGDRNAHFDTASAQILYGTISLKHFQGEAVCRLGLRGVPVCTSSIATPQILFSPLLLDTEVRNLPGTYQYQSTFSWIDDILVPATVLPFARKHFAKDGEFDAGVRYEPKDASDHGMIYLRLNW